MTKKLAEELARYLEEQQIKVCYLHSELKTPQRTELLQKLRLGIFDCLVGVNFYEKVSIFLKWHCCHYGCGY